MSTVDFDTLDLRDALDLAISIEEEARERYSELSRLVGGRYPGDAADAFQAMAIAEARHERLLSERRAALFPGAPRRVRREALEDVEAPDRGSPRVFMSPRQALEVALASEVKAQEFFAAARRHATDPVVRALFAELEAEEVTHQAFVAARMRGLPPGPDLEEGEADEPGSDPGN